MGWRHGLVAWVGYVRWPRGQLLYDSHDGATRLCAASASHPRGTNDFLTHCVSKNVCLAASDSRADTVRLLQGYCFQLDNFLIPYQSRKLGRSPSCIPLPAPHLPTRTTGSQTALTHPQDPPLTHPLTAVTPPLLLWPRLTHSHRLVHGEDAVPRHLALVHQPKHLGHALDLWGKRQVATSVAAYTRCTVA